MATSEIVVNEYLGAELRRRYSSWQRSGVVVCESTEAFSTKSQRPDLIVCDNPLSPVGIETEFSPANSVENDAASRLGKIYRPTGGTIHSVLAVRLPMKYRRLSGEDIARALATDTELQYCLLFGSSPTDRSRWPGAGYVAGSVMDLANVVSSAKVSPVTVSEGARILEEGARVLAAMLASASATNTSLGELIASHLKQDSGMQTFTMASTILINAFVFQETLARASTELADINSIYDYGAGTLKPTKKEVIAEWDRILKINYWPIFGISKQLVSAVPAAMWEPFSEACLGTADSLASLNLGKNPDLVGTIFQRLISDRRFLATFYTAPSSAALLARLMLGARQPHGGDWSQIERVKNLKLILLAERDRCYARSMRIFARMWRMLVPTVERSINGWSRIH
jgi:hypothetical protein